MEINQFYIFTRNVEGLYWSEQNAFFQQLQSSTTQAVSKVLLDSCCVEAKASSLIDKTIIVKNVAANDTVVKVFSTNLRFNKASLDLNTMINYFKMEKPASFFYDIINICIKDLNLKEESPLYLKYAELLCCRLLVKHPQFAKEKQTHGMLGIIAFMITCKLHEDYAVFLEDMLPSEKGYVTLEQRKVLESAFLYLINWDINFSPKITDDKALLQELLELETLIPEKKLLKMGFSYSSKDLQLIKLFEKFIKYLPICPEVQEFIEKKHKMDFLINILKNIIKNCYLMNLKGINKFLTAENMINILLEMKKINPDANLYNLEEMAKNFTEALVGYNLMHVVPLREKIYQEKTRQLLILLENEITTVCLNVSNKNSVS